MKAEIADAWIAALRSGEFKQTQSVLQDHNGSMCCLGVLCELHRRQVDGVWVSGNYLGEFSLLPSAVAKWAGMEDDSLGVLPVLVSVNNVHASALAMLNDRGATFSEIADVIEKYKDRL